MSSLMCRLSGARMKVARSSSSDSAMADAVASNGDVVHTYRTLLGHTPRGRVQGKRLAGKRHSMSLFVIHFGLKRRHTHLQHHTVCFGARYRELIQEIFDGPDLPDDFSLYLHAPCVTDASLAPPGCGAHYVLAPVPHLGNAAIDWAVNARVDVINLSLGTANPAHQARLGEAVQTVVRARNVSLLVSPQAVLFLQPTADITPAVTTELDRLVPSVNTTVPANWQPGQQQAAAGARPTTPPPVTPARTGGR